MALRTLSNKRLQPGRRRRGALRASASLIPRSWSRVIEIIGGLTLIGGLAALLLTLGRVTPKETVVSPPPRPEPTTADARAEAALASLMAVVNSRSCADLAPLTTGGMAMLPELTAHYLTRGRTLPKRVINPAVSAAEPGRTLKLYMDFKITAGGLVDRFAAGVLTVIGKVTA